MDFDSLKEVSSIAVLYCPLASCQFLQSCYRFSDLLDTRLLDIIKDVKKLGLAFSRLALRLEQGGQGEQEARASGDRWVGAGAEAEESKLIHIYTGASRVTFWIFCLETCLRPLSLSR